MLFPSIVVLDWSTDFGINLPNKIMIYLCRFKFQKHDGKNDGQVNFEKFTK